VKVFSGAELTELLVVDLFEASEDVQRVTTCEAAGTVQRLRRKGEKRQLLVVNFRIVPIHLVMVWALPDAGGNSEGPAMQLLRQFVGSMDDEERNRRLKVIPRLVEGSWVCRMALGETPAILGKNIPIDYYAGENEFEVSLGISSSSVAQRVVRVLKSAAEAVNVELALVLEATAEAELPEQVLGGGRLSFPDLATFRTVEP